MTTLIACVSDLHAGGSTALCPPTVTLDDGGTYHASTAQQWLWQCWADYWARVAVLRKQYRCPLYAVFNGDLVDGQHHGTTQVLSGNPNAQAAVVNAAMQVPLALEPDRLFFVRGTEVHVGQSASAEERIADGLRRDHRPVEGDRVHGTASHWHLRMSVRGLLIDVAHHGRTGQREHTRGGAAVLHAHDIFLAHAKRKERAPDLCLRAHYHRFNDSYDACPTRVVTTGAWQLATGYVHRVAPDTLADVGGVIVAVADDGTYTVEKVHFTPERSPIWHAPQ